MLIVDLYIPDV